MAISVSFNGVVYSIPETGEESWGENVTSFLVAIPSGALQKSGGSFTLTADVNFGATFGLLSRYFSTRTASPSTAGLVRLAVADSIGWRNNANGANLLLAVNGSNQLTFDGTAIYPAGITALTGDVTATGPGSVAATIAAGAINNAKVSASAGIVITKLQDIATATFLGRTTASTGAIEVLTATQATALINNMVGDSGSGGTKGLVPAPAAGDAAAARFLKADGTWEAPAGVGTVTSVALTVPTALFAISPVTGSPVTSAGTLAPTLATQNANTIFAGPTSGSAATPAFRAITPADMAEARNALLNSDFGLWQRGTSTTIANAATGYQPDRWYANNILGTSGVLTLSRQTAGVDGSAFACKLLITTAPVAAQTNGCELRYTLENKDSLQFYNQTASFGIQVKAFGNVNQVGVQFFYKTTEAKVDTAIGSEQTFTVSTGAYARCTISGQALGTSQTTSGVVGVRIRITGVSSGNTYDLNNGFQVEQAIMNLGSTPGNWRRAYTTAEAEVCACQRFYEKSYNLDVNPGTASSNPGGVLLCIGTDTVDSGQVYGWVAFKITKRTTPTVTVYGYAGNSAQVSNLSGTDLGGNTGTTQHEGQGGFWVQNTSGGAGSTSGRSVNFHYATDAEI